MLGLRQSAYGAVMSYRSLDPEKIAATARALDARIASRFPDAGLRNVSAALVQLAGQTAENTARLTPPIWALRGLIAALVIAGAVIFLRIGTILPLQRISQEVTGSVQGIESGLNTLILAILGLTALIRLEAHVKRQRVARDLHQLRAMIHIIDMHQLTKDPDTHAPDYHPTTASPKRDLTRAELTRYLDYCSEMLAITGKLAALYAQAVPDDRVANAVNDIETLGSNLSRKIWQKIMLLDALPRDHPHQAPRQIATPCCDGNRRLAGPISQSAIVMRRGSPCLLAQVEGKVTQSGIAVAPSCPTTGSFQEPDMTNDALVIFTPSGKRGRFAIGTPVLTAARQLGVDLDSVCGGRGICSKCQITPGYGEFAKHGLTVHANALSEWNAVEERYKTIRGLIPGRRLGCQAQVQGDVVIDVPPESQVHKQVVRKRVEARKIHMDPSVKLHFVEVAEPDMHDPSGDLERLSDALREQWGVESITIDLPVLTMLQPTLRKGAWQVTVALHQVAPTDTPRIMHLWPGLYEGSIYGVAVDLGSTTIAGHLCDLRSGEVIASSGLMNPQIRFGEDLMSRVSYSMMNPTGAADMTAAVRTAMNTLFGQLCEEAGVERGLIMDSVFVCNPVMHHLFLGIDPYELGQAPFALATSNSLRLTARDLDLDLHPAARVYILPCIAGHVGADAAAVALSEAPDKSPDLMLVVDVGTNAEILLGNTTKVLACSSPTGPAFEGAQISLRPTRRPRRHRTG